MNNNIEIISAEEAYTKTYEIHKHKFDNILKTIFEKSIYPTIHNAKYSCDFVHTSIIPDDVLDKLRQMGYSVKYHKDYCQKENDYYDNKTAININWGDKVY